MTLDLPRTLAGPDLVSFLSFGRKMRDCLDTSTSTMGPCTG